LVRKKSLCWTEQGGSYMSVVLAQQRTLRLFVHKQCGIGAHQIAKGRFLPKNCIHDASVLNSCTWLRHEFRTSIGMRTVKQMGLITMTDSCQKNETALLGGLSVRRYNNAGRLQVLMRYHLDDLGWYQFEWLTQAILKNMLAPPSKLGAEAVIGT